MNDLIIVGAGPAGLTAALYALRAGLNTKIFESTMYGGQIANTPEVENYPGVKKTSGWDFAQNLYEQVANLGVDITFEQVRKIETRDHIKNVITENNTYEAKSVIIANGAKRRKLGCPGEDTFSGRGVSYCATCDGAFFKGKKVAVVGGGNTALEDALYLSNICEKVYLIHRRDTFRGEAHILKEVFERTNVEILYSCVPYEILGDDSVNLFKIKKTTSNDIIELQVSAVFVAIGLDPDNAVFENILNLDNNGYIVAGEDCMTTAQGVFAAGDTRTKFMRQIVTAAADGAIAASQAAAYINSIWKK